MDALIRVKMLEDGRFVARVEPRGPVAEARSVDVAVLFAREAHESYLREHARWLPRGVCRGSVRYRVVGAVGLPS
jgi:hypothetical protein